MHGENFKYKNYEKLSDPEWPVFIKFVQTCHNEHLNLRGVFRGTRKSVELLSTALSLKPEPCKSLRILNLSMNNLDKENAKLLSPALAENTSVEVLDLSNNNFGVYGITLLS